jgi:HAD superfamily hydrolase (TIGR01549 family)
MFDLDGTLVNTVDAIVSTTNKVRVEFGYSERNQADLRELVGLNPAHFFEDLFLDPRESERLVMIFREYLNLHAFSHDDVYPGVIEVLTFLIGNNFPLAIATNKPTENARFLLEKVGLQHFFVHIQGSDNLLSKPSPEILIACQNIFHPTHSYMVGDRVEDIIAGAQSGALTIGIAQTTHTMMHFQEMGADFSFKDMVSFRSFLDSQR